MEREHPEIRVQRGADMPEPRPAERGEPSIGELFKRVTTDTSELVRQEIALAKVELQQSLATLMRDGVRAGIGFGLALVGFLAFTAFLIAGLGRLLGERYWLSALIIGVVFFVIGAVLAWSALSDITHHGLVPDQTAASLRQDAAWAKREAKEVKRELTT